MDCLTRLFFYLGRIRIGVTLAVCTVVLFGCAQESPSNPGAPVVFLLVDTLRADHIGAYGFDGPTSPEIDKIAEDSVLFERAYAPAPWTLPSLASIITSKPVCEHGVVVAKNRLSESIPTLAEQLQSIGYQTLGRTFNGYAGPNFGLDRGYDVMDAPGKTEKWEDIAANTAKRFDDGTLDITQPFFLYLHTIEPHEWFNVPAVFPGAFDFVTMDKRVKFKNALYDLNRFSLADWNAGSEIGSTDNTADQLKVMSRFNQNRGVAEKLYANAVRWGDNQVGDIVQLLKERGIWDRAIFVFLSDHGEELGEHGGWFHGQSAYEELLHVPLMIHFPGDDFGGTRVSSVVSLIDLMPTVFDYLDEPQLCSNCRGASLLPLITGAEDRDDDITVTAGMRMNRHSVFKPRKQRIGDTNIALRSGRYKGIWNEEPGTVEVYDLRKDTGEQTNLADKLPEMRDSFESFASDWYAECQAGAYETGVGEELDEETKKRMRALGYLE